MTLAQIPIVLFYRDGRHLCRVFAGERQTIHHRFSDLRWRHIDFRQKEQVIRADFATALQGSDEVTDTTARFNVV